MRHYVEELKTAREEGQTYLEQKKQQEQTGGEDGKQCRGEAEVKEKMSAWLQTAVRLQGRNS